MTVFICFNRVTFSWTKVIRALIGALIGLEKLPLDFELDVLADGDVIFLDTPIKPTRIPLNIQEYA